MAVARALGVDVHVDRGDGGEVDHGDTVPSSSWSAAPQASRSHSAPGAPISETLTGSPLRLPDAGRQRDDREARPVPVVRQREIFDVAERLVVPVATQAARRSGSSARRSRRSGARRTSRRQAPASSTRRVWPATYSSAVIARCSACSSRARFECRYSLAPVVEAAVPDEHLGEDEVEELGEHVEAGLRGRRLTRSPGSAASARSKPSATSGSRSAIRAATLRTAGAAGAPPARRRPPSPRAAARSPATVRAIGPGGRRSAASGTIPRIETRPRVGLIVDVPHSAEGMRSEPAVSVPVAAGTCRDASAAPSRRSSRRPSARAPRGSRPGRSCPRRRTRACAGGRAAPCPRRRGAPRRRSRGLAPRPARCSKR